MAYLRSRPQPATKPSNMMAFTNSHLRLSFREQEFDLAMDAFDRSPVDKAPRPSRFGTISGAATG